MQQETLGRGINVVIVDSRTKLVTQVENFDTYEFSKNYCLFHFSVSQNFYITKYILLCVIYILLHFLLYSCFNWPH